MWRSSLFEKCEAQKDNLCVAFYGRKYVKESCQYEKVKKIPRKQCL